MFFNKKKKKFIKITKEAYSFGLPAKDILTSKEFVENKEYGLAFEHLVTQLYEFDIEINKTYFEDIRAYAVLININENDYIFIQELIRSKEDIPKPVKDGIAEVVKKLKDSSDPIL